MTWLRSSRWAWCHLEASVGSTAPVKERRVPNDPKRLLGAEFGPISVPHCVFCGRCNKGGISAYRFFLFYGQCNTGRSCCLMKVRLRWPRTLYLWSSHLTAQFGTQKLTFCPFSSVGTLPYAHKTTKGRDSVYDKPLLRKASKLFFKTCLSR